MILEIQEKHIDECLALGRDMYQESCSKSVRFSRTKLHSLCFFLCNKLVPNFTCYVYEKDNKVVGFIVGQIQELLWSEDKIANEVVFYVSPEHRGSRAAFELISAYEDWAKKQGVKEIYLGSSTKVKTQQVERLYNKLGYDTVGMLTKKEV